MRSLKPNIFTFQNIVLFFFVVFGMFYIIGTWIYIENDKLDQALQIARSVETTLPKEDIKALEAKPADIDKPQYQRIKHILKAIIHVNNNAKAAYLYTEKSGKIYILADSEPQESKDYSPPGQEYSEADIAYKKPFKDGNTFITEPIPDRWGTWISVLVPVKDPNTGATVAVFGMDFDSKSWNNSLRYEVIESCVLMVLLLLILLFLFKIKVQNSLLKYEISKLRIAELELFQEKAQLKTIIDSSPASIWFKDMKNNFIRINSAAAKIAKRTVEEVEGHSTDEIFPNESANYFKDDLAVIRSGKPKLGIIEPANTSGINSWVRTDKIPWYGSDGKVAGVIAFSLDITDYIESEKKLNEGEQQMRLLLENSLDAIFLTVPDGNILSCNMAAQHIFGFTEAEFNQLGRSAILDLTDLRFGAALEERKRTGRFKGELTGQRKDGTKFPIEITSSLFNDQNGQPRSSMIIRDISERKIAEKVQRESAVRLRTLVQAIPDLIWLKDKEGVYLLCNTMFERFFGAREAEIVGKTDYNFVDSQLADGFRENDCKAMAANKPNRNEEWITFADDGHRALLETTKTPVYDSYGMLVGVLGIAHDITERNITEEKIKLFSAAIESAYDGIIITNMDGNISYANTSAINIFGYQPEEILKLSVESLTPDVVKAQEMTKELITTGMWSGETINITKSRVEFPAMLSITLIHDKVGLPIAMMGIFRDITEKKSAEKVSKAAYEELKNLQDNLNEALFSIDLVQNKTIKASSAHLAVFGYPPSDFLKNPQLFYELVIPEDRPIVDSGIQILSSGKKHQYEVRIIRRDGQLRWIEIKIWPTVDQSGILARIDGISSDITERKINDEKLKSLAHSLESISECVSITDIYDNITYVNQSFLQTYGYAETELIGQHIRMLRATEIEYSEVKDILQETLEGGWRGEIINKKKDGTLFPILLSTSAVKDENKKPVALIGVAIDITEMKQNREELIAAKEKAEESERLKSAFLANMSHEIRTPMNGILGFAGLLQEPNLTGEQQQEYIQIIEKSGNRMLNIINDIVNISKVESGQMKVSISDTNINKQIEYICTFFKPEAEQKGIQLSFKKTLPEKEAMVKTDREKVYAILTNLVKNAIKFTSEGSIELGYAKKGQYLEFFIKDTGMGVREEQKNFIFERFRQGSESLNRNFEGAGLGLAISTAYLEMLGGKIWVESEEGKGSVFYFTIPYIAASEERISPE